MMRFQPNRFALPLGRFIRYCVSASLLVLLQGVCSAQVYDNPEAAASDPSFAVQGEYVGDQRALQVIALGDGDYLVKVFSGGLPGAGWDRSPATELELDGQGVKEIVQSGKMQRVERTSPTLGLQPPPDAVVLFDGSQQSIDAHWLPGAKRTEDGLLIQGATSRDRFSDYSLHLEFRTPFMPEAEGQGRGNSGVYHQGRYETQILDSFGLEGKMNETGGLYSIRDPEINMCLPPLAWQTYDVDYKAARFDSTGRKVSNAEVTVRLNGVVVQSNVALTHATTAAPFPEGPDPGPIYLQDHGNPVRFRNVWVLPRDLEQEQRRPRVVGFERFFSSVGPTREGGQLLISELGCANCHQSTFGHLEQLVAPKEAPVLTRLGSRVRPEYVERFLASPHQVKPGTTMPDLMGHLDAEQKKSTVKALASFLASTGAFVERGAPKQWVESGEQIFHSIGCTACHDPQNGSATSEATSVPLGDLAAKYSLDGLADFLRDPHIVRPSGRMPTLGLGKEKSVQVAAYLLRDVVVGAGAVNVRAAFYEGSWDTLPDLDGLTPYLATETFDFDISASKRRDNFAARFETYFVAPVEANYRFYLGSDDGSRLFIDGEQIAIHDGIHPMGFINGRAKLSAGVHQVRVEYFEKGGEEELRVEVEGGGLVRSSLGFIATLNPSETKSRSDSPYNDLASIEHGKELFSSLGCANCHQLEMNGKPLKASQLLTLENAVQMDMGCLSPHANTNAPRYDLTTLQVASIREAMIAGKVEPDAQQGIRQAMATLNCYACHNRDGLGGPELVRDDTFTTSMKEMGDEGRLPPSLSGVGDKLRGDYIHKIVSQGADERPYMHVSMPGFGQKNLTALVDRIIALDAQTNAEVVVSDDSNVARKAAGRLLVGEKGLSCVKCHVFGGKGAPGIRAIDLQKMTSRLREDWFHRYLMSPTTYRPGTRMPASFPEGKSVLPDLFDGVPSRQIDAMWKYLEDGNKANPPIGIEQQMIELVADSRPVIYRNFIEGLTPRAIGVGYPEQLNLAWDANRMALTTLWKGAFIDASRHWVGRGPGNQNPLGDWPIEFETNSSVAILGTIDSAWPTVTDRKSGYQFIGYRLDHDGYPTFRYRIGDILVEDSPMPSQSETSPRVFRRRISIEAQEGDTTAYFRAAVGKSIQSEEDGWYRVDERFSVHLDREVTQVDVGGHVELRAALDLSRSPLEMEQTIRW